MTKISQTQYPGAGVSRDERRKNLLVLRDGFSGSQHIKMSFPSL